MKKSLLILVIIIAIPLTISVIAPAVSFIYGLYFPQKDSYYTEQFHKYREYAENTVEYLQNNFNTEPEAFFSIEFENNSAQLSHCRGKTEISDTAEEALCKIRSMFPGGFEYIEFSPDRITFSGVGTEMLVYSKNKSAPKYFFKDSAERNFFTYDLGDGWYFLSLATR